MRERFKELGAKLIHGDFLLWEPHQRFDLILGNPPYGIPSMSEHYSLRVEQSRKRQYRRLFRTWFGKYNIYGAFIEKAVTLLKKGGQLLYVVPASFLVLQEYKRLRAFLAYSGRCEIVYVGNHVFKPYADVSVVILSLTKGVDAGKLTLFEWDGDKTVTVHLTADWKGEPVTFKTSLTELLDSCCERTLSDVFQIRISPRTPEVQRNPFVVKSERCPNRGYLPILNGRNLNCGKIVYSLKSGYWIRRENIRSLRHFMGIPHLVVGLGFRNNGRLAAAYDAKCYPWMGDVYHLLPRHNALATSPYPPSDFIVKFLTSPLMAQYVKDKFKSISYHLSIVQIGMLPLPSPKTLQIIRRELSESGLERLVKTL